ncbi:hypothetical protein F4802DRAFT_553670 [Xylaria palmicola]|nr:hypothetical protein F4802DRAFT_553670 [Xylaria palmicola]
MAPNTDYLKLLSTGADSSDAQVPATDEVREDDASTLMEDELEMSPSAPIMDERRPCWRTLEVDSHDTSTVFESWEMISVRPTAELTSFKRVFGVNVLSSYKVLKDGYTGVRAIPAYSQADLAHMVASAESEWAAQQCRLARLIKQDTYSQELARRVAELPACLPSKLGALLDCRFVATNRSPCARREWKVVLLRPIVEFMTNVGLDTGNRGVWSWSNSRQNEPIQKWLVILRGQTTRVSERGFATFSTTSNPWIRVDERLQETTAE